jgi:hypothetical protein
MQIIVINFLYRKKLLYLFYKKHICIKDKTIFSEMNITSIIYHIIFIVIKVLKNT